MKSDGSTTLTNLYLSLETDCQLSIFLIASYHHRCFIRGLIENIFYTFGLFQWIGIVVRE